MRDIIELRDTKFQFKPDFSGNKYGPQSRYATVTIPDHRMARQLIEEGFNIGMTRPHEDQDPDTFIPEYFINVKARYRNRFNELLKNPPRIRLINDKMIPQLMDEDTVGQIDSIDVKKVNCTIRCWENDKGTISCDIADMYIEQGSNRRDPFYDQYYNQNSLGYHYSQLVEALKDGDDNKRDLIIKNIIIMAERDAAESVGPTEDEEMPFK